MRDLLLTERIADDLVEARRNNDTDTLCLLNKIRHDVMQATAGRMVFDSDYKVAIDKSLALFRKSIKDIGPGVIACSLIRYEEILSKYESFEIEVPDLEIIVDSLIDSGNKTLADIMRIIRAMGIRVSMQMAYDLVKIKVGGIS